MREPRKAIAIVASAMVLAGSVAAFQSPTQAQQLPPSQQMAVQALADDGILDGTGCSPDECSGSVERWEVAMWIVRLLDGEPASIESFTDVDPAATYARHVQALFNLGVTVGCMTDPLHFCPERDATRGQMSAFVTRAYGLSDFVPRPSLADVPPGHVFADNIAALINAGVATPGCIDGTDRFCSHLAVTGAQAVEWLYNASQVLESAEAADGEDEGGDNGDGSNNNGDGSNNGGGGNTGGGNTGGGNTGGGNTGGENTGGGNNGGGNNGGGDNNGDTGDGDGGGDPIVGGGPGGVEYDIGPNGECTHWDYHRRGDGADRKSHVLLGEAVMLEDDRTLAAGLYAHRHDPDGLKWWFWDPELDEAPPVNLFEDDPRIPCDHAECPTHDHGQNGTDSADYVVAAEHSQSKTFSHTHSDPNDLVEGSTWEVGDTTLNADPPCSHES